jgi:TatD DNase family protein
LGIYRKELALYDSHCHLDFPELSENLEDYLAQAQSCGTTGIIIPGVSGAVSLKNLSPLPKTPHLLFAWGIHPQNFSANIINQDFEELVTNLSYTPLAIGECGLDKRLAISLEDQVLLFEKQLKLAKKLSLPLIIHQVGYWGKIMEIFRKFEANDIPWIFHSFNGSAELAKEIASNGGYISIGSGIFRKSAKRLEESIKTVPLSALLVETDAPVSKKNKTNLDFNKPCGLIAILKRTADILEIDFTELKTVISENTRNCFKIV